MIWRVVICIAILSVLSGCTPQTDQVDTRYGLSSRAPASINGTSLLVKKLEALGNRVRVKRRITPDISNFDVVFWIPDSTNAPSPEATQALEDWLNEYYIKRTLVYVGRHYSAESDYLEAIVEGVEGELREEILRRIAEAKVADPYDQYTTWYSIREDCDWYVTEHHDETTSNQLGGRLSRRIPQEDRPEITYSTLMKASSNHMTFRSYERIGWTRTNLLFVDGKSFVSKLTNDMGADSSIILVSNGCFLLNFGLVDPKKERIADRLLATLPNNTDVLILESGPRDIDISDSNYENHNSWAWIAEAPLRYIVPHFLLWGVLFCFVFYPILGRPRQTKKESTTSFRNHINAIAKQLARAGKVHKARQTINNYLQLTDDKGKRKPD
ncbi:MAG: hypothetical protein AAFN77_05710 [Planctomycetota bacterium]